TASTTRTQAEHSCAYVCFADRRGRARDRGGEASPSTSRDTPSLVAWVPMGPGQPCAAGFGSRFRLPRNGRIVPSQYLKSRLAALFVSCGDRLRRRGPYDFGFAAGGFTLPAPSAHLSGAIRSNLLRREAWRMNCPL